MGTAICIGFNKKCYVTVLMIARSIMCAYTGTRPFMCIYTYQGSANQTRNSENSWELMSRATGPQVQNILDYCSSLVVHCGFPLWLMMRRQRGQSSTMQRELPDPLDYSADQPGKANWPKCGVFLLSATWLLYQHCFNSCGF